jgi:hypothetical protein
MLVLALLVGACQERITAPGVCPEFCPPDQIVTRDTLLTSIVSGDSAFRGYRSSLQGERGQVVTFGSPQQAVGYLVYNQFPLRLDGNDTIVTQDSFGLSIAVLGRDTMVTDMELAVHLLPEWADTVRSLDALLPWFDDSTVIGTDSVPDSLRFGTVVVGIDSSYLARNVREREGVNLGVTLRAPQEAALSIGMFEGTSAPNLVRYVSGSAENLISDAIFPFVDGFLTGDPPPFDASVLAIGGAPSARALLRFDLPSFIIDSSSISRATLIMVPDGPIAGVAPDSVRLRAAPVFNDAGRKSITIEQFETSDTTALSVLRAGAQDTVFLEVTDILRQWTANELLPRAMVLSVTGEGSGLIEARFASSQGTAPPGIRITYIPRPELP